MMTSRGREARGCNVSRLRVLLASLCIYMSCMILTEPDSHHPPPVNIEGEEQQIRKYVNEKPSTGEVTFRKLEPGASIVWRKHRENLRRRSLQNAKEEINEHNKLNLISTKITSNQSQQKRIREGRTGLGFIGTDEEVHSANLKAIVVHSDERYQDLGQEVFKKDNCKVQTCSLYKSDNHLIKSGEIKADAVILSTYEIEGDHRTILKQMKRSPHQVYILYLSESPLNTGDLSHLNGKINWTISYRRDSTIVSPYGMYAKGSSPMFMTGASSHKVNYAKGKDKLVAWFVSNCGSKTGRLAYVSQLQKYIQVDVYGVCGPLKCDISHQTECLDMLRRRYKFYLSFENSPCEDYVSEKLWNALSSDVVPVVMGPPKEDYEQVAPPNSFIHVDDFSSPRELAKFLLHLSRDDKEYNRYFRWHQEGYIMKNNLMCDLCARLHEDTDASWYNDVNRWWNGPDVCDQPNYEDFEIGFDVTDFLKKRGHP